MTKERVVITGDSAGICCCINCGKRGWETCWVSKTSFPSFFPMKLAALQMDAGRIDPLPVNVMVVLAHEDAAG